MQGRDTPAWDPAQYAKFGDLRLRPALELLQRVPLRSPRLVYDLGCGDGRATRALAERWPEARVIGVDASREMLERARGAGAVEVGAIEWVEARIEDWHPATPPDLVFSNAALHWITGHDALVPRLCASLRAGGVLALQMPMSWDLPSHRLVRATLADGGPGGTALGPAALRERLARRPVAAPETYYDWLAPHAERIDIWQTELVQVLAGEAPVLEWIRGTALLPVLEALSDAERGRFLSTLAPRLSAAYPRRPDGSTLYPFRRLFVVATRRA